MEASDEAVIRDPEGLEDEAEEFNFLYGVIFVDIGADIPDIDASGEEVCADVHGIGRCGSIAVGASICNDGSIEGGGDLWCEFDVEGIHEVIDDFACGGSLIVMEVYEAVSPGDAMMVDEDARAFKFTMGEIFPEQSGFSAIEDEEEVVVIVRELVNDIAGAVEEGEVIGEVIDIKDGDIFIECAEDVSHSDSGASGIAIGSAVHGDEDFLSPVNGIDSGG